MTNELLYGINEWVLFFVAVGFLFGSAEVGFRWGKRTAGQGTGAGTGDPHPHVATLEAALLGMLALLLGFAFAMAMNRFEARKQVVLEEANDIQTAYLRSKLLPERWRDECARLLREYLDSRIEDVQAWRDSEQARRVQARSVEIQAKLWAAALEAAREKPDEVTTGYFIESLNRMIDDHTKRAVATENHVPEAILHLLMFVASVTVAVTGYSSGLKGQRLPELRLILCVLIAAILLVILDLDRPRRGLIKVSEQALVLLRSQLDAFGR